MSRIRYDQRNRTHLEISLGWVKGSLDFLTGRARTDHLFNRSLYMPRNMYEPSIHDVLTKHGLAIHSATMYGVSGNGYVIGGDSQYYWPIASGLDVYWTGIKAEKTLSVSPPLLSPESKSLTLMINDDPGGYIYSFGAVPVSYFILREVACSFLRALNVGVINALADALRETIVRLQNADSDTSDLMLRTDPEAVMFYRANYEYISLLLTHWPCDLYRMSPLYEILKDAAPEAQIDLLEPYDDAFRMRQGLRVAQGGPSRLVAHV